MRAPGTNRGTVCAGRGHSLAGTDRFVEAAASFVMATNGARDGQEREHRSEQGRRLARLLVGPLGEASERRLEDREQGRLRHLGGGHAVVRPRAAQACALLGSLDPGGDGALAGLGRQDRVGDEVRGADLGGERDALGCLAVGLVGLRRLLVARPSELDLVRGPGAEARQQGGEVVVPGVGHGVEHVDEGLGGRHGVVAGVVVFAEGDAEHCAQGREPPRPADAREPEQRPAGVEHGQVGEVEPDPEQFLPEHRHVEARLVRHENEALSRQRGEVREETRGLRREGRGGRHVAGLDAVDARAHRVDVALGVHVGSRPAARLDLAAPDRDGPPRHDAKGSTRDRRLCRLEVDHEEADAVPQPGARRAAHRIPRSAASAASSAGSRSDE